MENVDATMSITTKCIYFKTKETEKNQLIRFDLNRADIIWIFQDIKQVEQAFRLNGAENNYI